MAYELAIYETSRKIIAHRPNCKTISSVPRTSGRGHTVNLEPGWVLSPCEVCHPYVFVVHVVAARLRTPRAPARPATSTPAPAITSVPSAPATPTSREHPAQGAPAPTPALEPDVGSEVPALSPADLTRERDVRLKAMVERFERRLNNSIHDQSWPPHGVTALDITHSQNRQGWQRWGNCRASGELGKWLKWLFTADHTKEWTKNLRKVICAECMVRPECLEQGVYGTEIVGIWGGATPLERGRLRRKWRQEGRVDERPVTIRPRDSRVVQRQDGGRNTATRRDVPAGTSEASRAYEAAREDMLEVWPESDVQESRSHGVAEWDPRDSLGPW